MQSHLVIIFQTNNFYSVSMVLHPSLYSYEWINYKILMMVFKCKHKLAPSYLQELISFEYNRPLRLATNHDIPVVKCNTALVHNASFKSIGPRLWNALPTNIKAINTLSEFKTYLKTHLFCLSYNILTQS